MPLPLLNCIVNTIDVYLHTEAAIWAGGRARSGRVKLSFIGKILTGGPSWAKFGSIFSD